MLILVYFENFRIKNVVYWKSLVKITQFQEISCNLVQLLVLLFNEICTLFISFNLLTFYKIEGNESQVLQEITKDQSKEMADT